MDSVARFTDCNIYGVTGLQLQDGAEVVTDIYGLDTSTCVFKCPLDNALSFRGTGKRHPYYSWLWLEKETMVLSPGLAVFTCYFAGILKSPTESVYELSIGESQEPIETHPDFITKIGGKPSDPLNGAIFIDYETNGISKDNTRGVFERFATMNGGSKNQFAGVVSYFDPAQVRWKRTYCTLTRPSNVSSLGRISSPPGGPPSLGGGKNWLYTGLNYQQRGNCFTVTEEWMGSGRGGWNKIIY